MTDIRICPRCKKPTEAKEYFTTLGMSDWRVETTGIVIECSKCGYRGLPVEVSPRELEMLQKAEKKEDG